MQINYNRNRALNSLRILDPGIILNAEIKEKVLNSDLIAYEYILVDFLFLNSILKIVWNFFFFKSNIGLVSEKCKRSNFVKNHYLKFLEKTI